MPKKLVAGLLGKGYRYLRDNLSDNAWRRYEKLFEEEYPQGNIENIDSAMYDAVIGGREVQNQVRRDARERFTERELEGFTPGGARDLARKHIHKSPESSQMILWPKPEDVMHLPEWERRKIYEKYFKIYQNSLGRVDDAGFPNEGYTARVRDIHNRPGRDRWSR